eukprot:TRINITY_DN6228_c0_g1_i11.p1 TRINITY_DN6228_c0_g1~~TRINITY_DN6228_c0_g1_i11.p1  ORF type:complete len:120 (+),score=12.20 TRINITY_DN6228_c0_g1_i11:47-406(+)
MIILLLHHSNTCTIVLKNSMHPILTYRNLLLCILGFHVGCILTAWTLSTKFIFQFSFNLAVCTSNSFGTFYSREPMRGRTGESHDLGDMVAGFSLISDSRPWVASSSPPDFFCSFNWLT